MDDLFRRRDLVLRQLRDVKETLEVILELHEDAEVGDLRHLAADDRSDLVAVGNRLAPRIGLELLETESDTLALLVDLQHDRLDRVALLDDLVRVDDLARPRHVGDVQEAVDTVFELDEGTVVRQVANLALDVRADRVLLRNERPRVDLDLLHTEGDFLLLLLDLEDDHLDLVADRDDLVRVVDALRPRHLGDVNETLDARLELDEGTVREHVDDLAADARADGVLGLDRRPGALFLLLETERDALLLLVDLEHLDLDLLIDREELRGVIDTTPAHVGDVEETVETAQVDEGAELGDVLDDTLADLADLDVLEERLLLLVALFLDQATARHDDVHARFVDLDDLALDLLPDVLRDVTRAADADLRSGQEDRDADLDEETALDLAADLTGDVVTFLVRVDDTFPSALAICLALRQADQPVFVLDGLEEHLDLVSRLELGGVLELIEGNRAFRLVTDVDDRIVTDDVDHLSLDDLVLLEALRGIRIPLLDGARVCLAHRCGDLLLELFLGKIELFDLGVDGHGKKRHLRRLSCSASRSENRPPFNIERQPARTPRPDQGSAAR